MDTETTDILDPGVLATLMELPDANAKVYEKKRYAGEPDISLLKDQQLENFTAMQEFLREEGGGFFLLRGFAGTGKTFTIGKVIEWYLQVNRMDKIAITAPTNKAVKVINAASDFVHSNVKYLTIHSLLGLKEQIDNYGKQKFVQDKKNPPKIEEYSVLVVDETSMLSDELFLGSEGGTGIIDYVGEFEAQVKTKGVSFSNLSSQLVTSYKSHKGLKVIFMGDTAQIPPVGKPDCIPFSEAGQKKYNIRVGDLTQIVRQAAGNPIIATTMKIRDSLHRPTTFPTRETQLIDGGKGVVFVEKGVPGHSEIVEEMLEKYFCSENFKLNADFVKCIAWRNKTVNSLNKFIRNMLYGEAAIERIVIGEKLIANKPIIDPPTILFNTNDEFEVIAYKEAVEKINGGADKGGFDIWYYETQVRYEVYATGQEMTAIVKIVHNRSMDTYEHIMETLRKRALSFKQGSWEAGKAWQDYFSFQETFADVNYNYAITAHKSQGSTYEYALVFCNDIDANPNVYERNRIKYTACSRPKSRLIIVV